MTDEVDRRCDDVQLRRRSALGGCFVQLGDGDNDGGGSAVVDGADDAEEGGVARVAVAQYVERVVTESLGAWCGAPSQDGIGIDGLVQYDDNSYRGRAAGQWRRSRS